MIVYNERGHRIEDEDLDFYPEDETQSYQTSRRSNFGTSANGTPPSSRPRTPVNAYYPSNPIAGSGSGHRTSTLSTVDGGVVERTSSSNTSKGYASSITPSTSARSVSGPAGHSDLETRSRKGKGKERDGYSGYEDSLKEKEKDRASSVYTVTPTTALDKTSSRGGPGSIYGAPSSVSRRESTAGGVGSIYSPSVRPPTSRSVSFYGEGGGAGSGDYPPPHSGGPEGSPDGQVWGAGGTPKSAADERYMWGDNPNGHNNNNTSPFRSPPSAQLDAILDRPRSPFPTGGSPSAAGGVEVVEPNNKSPFAQSAAYDFGGAHNDRPKSAFGDVPPPLMFGDGGPAAVTGRNGGGGGLFGDPPASVFGESASPVVGAGASGETNHNNTNASEGWGYGSSGPTTPASTTSGKKGKKKTTTNAFGTPASGNGAGLGSKTNSPSAFGTRNDDLGVGAGAGGLLGTTGSSKAPSPYEKGKPLSPLNPAAQMNNEGGSWGGGADLNRDFGEGGGGGGESWGFDNANAPPANGSWGFDGGAEGGEGATDLQARNEAAPSGWGQVNLNEPAKVPSRVPSPAPPPETPVDEPEINVVGKGKKKKKGPTASEERKKREEEEERAKEEQRKMEAETERLRREAEEKERLEIQRQEEARIEAEQQRQWEEAEERRVQEEQERQEQERKAHEEQEAARQAAEEENKRKAAEARRTSLFGSTTSFLSGAVDSVSAGLTGPDKLWGTGDSGGGEDSWGLGSGFGKKKKAKGGNTATNALAQPSAFGATPSFGGGSSWSMFGGANDEGDSSAANPIESQTTPAFEFSSNPGDNMFDFSSSTVPNLGFDLGGGGLDRTSYPPSPKPGAGADLVDEPLTTHTPTGEDATKEGGEEGEGGGNNGEVTATADDDYGFEDAGAKKKKGKKVKKGGLADNTPADDTNTPADAPAGEGAPPTAEADDGFSAPSGKKKKKKR